MDEQLQKILKYIPRRIALELEDFFYSIRGQTSYVSEIRLRADSPISVSFRGKNISIFQGRYLICTEKEVSETLQKLCEDSIHTFGETLKEGYVVLQNGYRIGVCGKVGISEERIRNIYEVTSLCIRIPHPIEDVSDDILPYITEGGILQSALIYSVPNVGKTTLIRDMAAKIAGGMNSYRIALIDTRGEIYLKEMFSEQMADVLHGYPRAKGIEIATRTLSPELIFCDEIGSEEEAKAILSAQNSGVPLIATAHADSLETLFRRSNIKRLKDAEIFRYYIGISRKANTKKFHFEVFDSRKAEVFSI